MAEANAKRTHGLKEWGMEKDNIEQVKGIVFAAALKLIPRSSWHFTSKDNLSGMNS